MTSNYQRGFTLLEMMLVIVLLAMVSMLAVSALPSRSVDLQKEGKRLLHVLQWAQDQSMLTGDIYGLSINRESWQLLKVCQLNCGKAVISSAENILPGAVWVTVKQRARPLRGKLEELELHLDVEGGLHSLFDTDEASVIPQIFIYPGGESSQFKLYLTDAVRRESLMLKSQGIGWVELKEERRGG